MKTIKATIAEVFEKLNFEKFLISVNLRFIILNILGFYTIAVSAIGETSSVESTIIFFLLAMFAIFNSSNKERYEMFKNKLFLYSFYTIEVITVYLCNKYLTTFESYYFHPAAILFFITILISSFHDDSKIILYVTLISIIARAIMFLDDSTFEVYTKILKNSENTSIIYLIDLIFSTAFLGFFGWSIHRFIDNANKTKKIISIVSFKEVFDSAFELMSFINKKKIFFNRFLISSFQEQSEYLGGGDFVCVEEIGDHVYGIIGDITSHGTNMMSGAYIASSAFKASLHTGNFVTTADILNSISNVLSNLDSKNGGSGIAICFRINKKGKFYYSGFIYKDCFTLDGEVQPLTYAISLGERANYKIDNELELQWRPGSKAVIMTDGWLEEGDDRTKIEIQYLKNENN
jgi:uncharacterized membrane protein YbaN (DUF454 family)